MDGWWSPAGSICVKSSFFSHAFVTSKSSSGIVAPFTFAALLTIVIASSYLPTDINQRGLSGIRNHNPSKTAHGKYATSWRVYQSRMYNASIPSNISPKAKGTSMTIPISIVYLNPTYSTAMTNVTMKHPMPPIPVMKRKKPKAPNVGIIAPSKADTTTKRMAIIRAVILPNLSEIMPKNMEPNSNPSM